MLDASLNRILERLGDGQKLLDVGAWGKPFTRADWVIDLMPYETRGLYGHDGDGPERFSADTWVVRDICDAEPWPFADDEFDFVICSHVLEDVRDPVRVCSELARVAKAGYIEVPSRLEEQSYGFQGPWVGWGHHHWLIDVEGDSIDFVFKHHVLHGREEDHFPEWFQPALTAEERVEQLWWDGGFAYRERVILEPAELDSYLRDFVAAELEARSDRAPSTAGRLRRKLRG